MARGDSLVGVIAELAKADVDYILVGGMAAAVHGAPVTTLEDRQHKRCFLRNLSPFPSSDPF
jgi:hypothetical protein